MSKYIYEHKKALNETNKSSFKIDEYYYSQKTNTKEILVFSYNIQYYFEFGIIFVLSRNHIDHSIITILMKTLNVIVV